MTYPDVIETERMTLRRPRASDAGPISLYAGDIRVAKMTSSIPHPYPPGAAEAFVRRCLADKIREHAWIMDASRIGGAEFIGVISLIQRDDDVEIGYWVGPPFWNTHYATEATEAAVAAADTAGVARLIGRASTDNEASARVLLSNGFRETGASETYCVSAGAMQPVRLFQRGA